MTDYRVEITDRALDDLDAAVAYLADRSPAAAGRWLGSIEEAIATLERNPARWPLAPEAEWYDGELRQLLHGKGRGVYRILFEVRGETVVILRVRHGRQNFLRREDV